MKNGQSSSMSLHLSNHDLWQIRQFEEDRKVFWRGHPSDDITGEVVAALEGEYGRNLSAVSDVLRTLRGHFSFIAVADSVTLVAVDHTRSIPLFFAETKNGWQVGDDANRLRNLLSLIVAILILTHIYLLQCLAPL